MRKNKLKNIIIMKKSFLVALSCSLLLCSCGGGDKKNQMQVGDDEFAVITVGTSSAEINTAYPATMKGEEVIEIRPKVTGHITKVLVQEGATVRRGQALFQIDAVQYSAAVQQAQAAVNVAQTSLNTQRLSLQNTKVLHDKKIVADYDYQLAQNAVASAEAQLQQAQAALASARNNLSFCTVTSPANGVIGTINFRVGSLVSASTQQPLTTLANTGVIYAYFSMTEKQILTLTRQTSGNTAAAMNALPNVTLKLSDGSIYDGVGKVNAISGLVDASTGAVQVRADFTNPQGILRSGGAATILMPTKVTNSIIIPQKACYKIQEKTFCYVVDAKNKIHNTEIEVMTQEDGTNFIVTSGLKAGDRLVVEGLNKLKDGQEIKPISEEESAKKLDKAKKHMEEKKLPME